MITEKLPQLTLIDGEHIRINVGVLEAVDRIYVSLSGKSFSTQFDADLDAAEEFANAMLAYVEQHRRTMARRTERTPDNLNSMFNSAL